MITERKPPSERRTCSPVYHSFQVRRGFSILLVLIFLLGPLATLPAASEDASLPACCRRNGEHHCAMAMQGMAAATPVPAGASPVLQAPLQCPYYPHSAVRNAPVHAVAVTFPNGAALLVQPYRHTAGRAAPLLNPVAPLAGRGPPALNLG
jgi:hypothetical protein